jgi:general secretion pathway protein G
MKVCHYPELSSEGGYKMGHRRKTHRGEFLSNAGFTLIELLTVIVIIGILAGIALPAVNIARRKGRIAAVKEQLRQIETALEEYYAEYDTYPPLGNDWLGGGFFPSEDIGADGIQPFTYSGGTWNPNNAYTGPDADGTEGNYRLDHPNEDNGIYPWLGANDPTRNNGRLDGTYYDRLQMFGDEDTQALIDIFAERTYYHYYPGYVYGKTSLGMPKYKSWDDENATTGALDEYKEDPPPYYNRWVIYSVGLDRSDHVLHNYYLVMQDGEDVGSDAFASDPTDMDGDRILFEPSDDDTGTDGVQGENDAANTALGPQRIIVESGFRTPGSGQERMAPGGNNAKLEGPKGEPIFSYDIRVERRRDEAVYIMPDGDKVAYGPIMRYGP